MKYRRCRSNCKVCNRIKYVVGDGRCEENEGHSGSHSHSDYAHNSDRIVTHRWKNRKGKLQTKK